MDYTNTLPGIVLPNPEKNSSIIKESKSSITKKIKTLVEEMDKRQTRTTNFALIVYLVKNEYKKMAFKLLTEKIKRDYEGHQVVFLNSLSKKPFEQEVRVMNSIKSSLYRNKSFNIEKVNGEKYISLNLEKALQYLEKMHQKYINKELDVSSISSAGSPRKINYKNEEEDKKFLGYKTLRKKQKKKYPKQRLDSLDSSDSFDVIAEEKSLSTYKYLRENLKPKFNEISNKKKMNNMKSKSKEKIIDNVFDKDFSFRVKNCDENNFADKNKKEIVNSMNTVDESTNILATYKKKLKNLQSKVDQRDKNLEEFRKVKNKLIKEKSDLKTLYQVLELKYEYVKNIKNSKYLGDIFEQTKKNLKLYRTVIDSKIRNFKLHLKESIKLEKNVITKENELLNDSDSITLDDNINKGLDEMNEYMVKKNYCYLINNIKADCMAENGNNDYCEGNNIEIVNMIEAKMNELWEKIKEEE